MLQTVQSFLEGRLSGLPPDMAWVGIKSAGYSFTVSMVITGGDYGAGFQSAYLSALAAAIYGVIVALMKQQMDPGPYKPFFLSLGVVQTIGDKVGFYLSIPATLAATAIPSLLEWPKSETPIFGIIVC